jgi:hypothetical protein
MSVTPSPTAARKSTAMFIPFDVGKRCTQAGHAPFVGLRDLASVKLTMIKAGITSLEDCWRYCICSILQTDSLVLNKKE